MSRNKLFQHLKLTSGAKIQRCLLFLFVAVSIFVMSSCASVSKYSTNFETQQKANVAVFADQTVSLVSNFDFGVTRKEMFHTRPFFNLQGQQEKKFYEYRVEANDYFVGIIRYSMSLVTITETKKSSAEIIAAYHDYLAGMNAQVLKKLDLSHDYYDHILVEIAGSQKFLDALKAAVPIISAFGRHMYATLNNLDQQAEELADIMDQRIREEYADVIQYQTALERETYKILRSIAFLYLAYEGDGAAFRRLAEQGAVRNKKLIPQHSPTEDDLQAIGHHLEKRLKALHLIEEQIKPRWEKYQATQRELVKLLDKVKSENNRARVMTLVWMRAHENMAAGVTTPAEWFNIKTLPAELIKTGTKAIF